MLAGMESFRTHVVLLEREDGLPCLRIIDLTRAATSALEGSHRIEFAEPAYNASLGANPEFDANQVRFQYESFVTPRSVFDYDVRTRRTHPSKAAAGAGRIRSDRNTSASVCTPRHPMGRACRFPSSTVVTRRAMALRRCFCMATEATASRCLWLSVRIA